MAVTWSACAMRGWVSISTTASSQRPADSSASLVSMERSWLLPGSLADNSARITG
ncbi:hypothetical protein FAM14222_001473 [Propionibacterium freudenreichii]|uniref:hypothetical protein n=1 Tax=Propionibacterium freudenreichii TaxID=1744 RepID=UPI00254C31FC|nr:hypothetical protein [Propionibacterium freudenreichii]MDK9593148.1 hypothetical protein [Propionibacterium freudenreichii]